LITIVDYGMGNLASISNMLHRLGIPSRLASRPAEVASAEALILPGVGAFDTGMRRLRESGLAEALDHKVRTSRAPLLGICLGMQLFARGSEEGSEVGFGWVDATCIRFRGRTLKVPHMGWNTVEVVKDSPLLEGLEVSKFYFVHSFHLSLGNTESLVAETRHGSAFPSVVEAGNLLGVQFHPEKSHKYGMHLLRNFSDHYLT
jgi:glutamine amidotransferase